MDVEKLIETVPGKENIVLNVNMEIISRSDFNPEIFIAGTYHYPYLKRTLQKIESEKIAILFGHDDPYNKEQYDWTFIGDHKVFHREGVPFLYFGVENHKDYHKPTDDFATINQEFYIDVVKVVIQTIERMDALL